MLTYWCSSRCAFCYVHAGPEQHGWMSVATAVRLWRELHELAISNDRTMRVHLAGGEPFGDWKRLTAILQAARDEGLPPAEKIETNAHWATDDETTRGRLEVLRDLAVERLIVSSDVFHQEFVPFDRVERRVRMSREVFGKGGLIVRWWDFFQQPVDATQMTLDQRTAAFGAASSSTPIGWPDVPPRNSLTCCRFIRRRLSRTTTAQTRFCSAATCTSISTATCSRAPAAASSWGGAAPSSAGEEEPQ